MVGCNVNRRRRLASAIVGGVMACALAASAAAQGRRADEPTAPPVQLRAVIAQPPEPPAPGKAVEIWVDRQSQVTSAWLSNGVLFHHRFLSPPQPGDEHRDASSQAKGPNARGEHVPPEVAVSITIAGSELLETPENRGISDAAVAGAWAARSVRSMKPGELGAYLESCGANVFGMGGGDAFLLSAGGSSEKIESILRGVHLMLSEPRIDAHQLAEWQEETVKQIEERQHAGDGGFAGVIARKFGPQDPRAHRPTPESIRGITPDSAQAWLDRALGTGAEARGMPMEVAIVGDIPVDRAIHLAEVYFGSLPARDRIGDATLADKRVAQRPARPPEVIDSPDWKGTPLVLVGFFGADLRDINDYRALAVGAEVLSNRLNRLPAEQNDANRAGARAAPAMVYPGFGLFLASTRAREGNEAGASENIVKLLQDVVDHGPSEDELATARKNLSGSAAKMLAQPSYWAWTLSHSAYQGIRVPEIGAAEKAYQEMKGEQVVNAIKKYWTPERSIKLIVKAAPGKDAVQQ